MTKMVKINSGDPGFRLKSDLALYQRAALDIHSDCPTEIVYLLNEAINRKWISLIAYVPEEQYAWEKLKGVSE